MFLVVDNYKPVLPFTYKLFIFSKRWIIIKRMNSQLLYQEDSTILEFAATVVEKVTLPDGRKGVVLDQSYFYPTGGGQEHDTGEIDSIRVVDVFEDEGKSHLVHVVDGEINIGLVKARIDAERRVRKYRVAGVFQTGRYDYDRNLEVCLISPSGTRVTSYGKASSEARR